MSATTFHVVDHDAVGIGLDLDETPDGAACDEALFLVEAHQTDVRDQQRRD